MSAAQYQAWPLVLLCGPTGSGKTALAMGISRQAPCEVISADSMQIYRGCDIVTAKPTRWEQGQVHHHLLDIRDPVERYSAGEFGEQAGLLVKQIRARGKIPVVCGGTGFYFRALVQPEKIPAQAPAPELSAQLEQELGIHGPEHMYQRLIRMNAERAARIHPNDIYRVMRALEICLSPASPVTAATATPTPYLAFGLEWPREVLYERLDERVGDMVAQGALEETRQLLERWGAEAPALCSVGYKQLLPHLRGESSLELALENWQRETRRYAKRQLTWFRHQLATQWLDPSRGLDSLASAILSQAAAVSRSS